MAGAPSPTAIFGTEFPGVRVTVRPESIDVGRAARYVPVVERVRSPKLQRQAGCGK